MVFEIWDDPRKLLKLTDEEALGKFKKPTLIRIKGKDNSKAVLVSVLLHGNEPCGFRAFLREINLKLKYPHDLFFFVGNVKAAQKKPYFSQKMIPKGEDFNQIWVDKPKTKEQSKAREIWAYLETLPLIGHLDLHSFASYETLPHTFTPNFEEKNQEVMNKLTPFIFISDQPNGELTQKTISFCPAGIVECGTNNSLEANQFATEVLQRFLIALGMKKGPSRSFRPHVCFHLANLKVKEKVSVSWANKKDPEAKLTLRADVAKLNLKELAAGEFLGWCDSLNVFKITRKERKVKPEELFILTEGKLVLKEKVVPTLMATNESIIKTKGFYFFKKVDLKGI